MNISHYQVLQYFDKSSVKPAPHEYEFIDLTCTEEGMGDRGDFEEISLLDRKVTLITILKIP